MNRGEKAKKQAKKDVLLHHGNATAHHSFLLLPFQLWQSPVG
jgi:hypothetical protein